MRSTIACPTLGRQAFNNDRAGNTAKDAFHFHGCDHMVSVVHDEEARFKIHQADRAFRLVLNVADNAIEGPGSVQFRRCEAAKDGVLYDPISSGQCEFHGLDTGGEHADALWEECQLYDNLCRLVRSNFAWGTGKLRLRAVAAEHRRIATRLEAEAGKHLDFAAGADARGKTDVAASHRAKAK